MGSVCCVAVKDRTITDRTIINRPAGEILQRNIRNSPSWSFRWENRGRVAGEETSINWLSEGVSGTPHNDPLDINKSGTPPNVSEQGSPVNSFRSVTWQKSPVSEGHSGTLRLPSSDSSVPRYSNPVITSPTISHGSPSKPSFSSISTSPLSSNSYPIPTTLTPSRYPHHSPIRPGYMLGPSISEEETSLPSWSNESMRGSNAGSFDSWTIPTFPELTKRWSFDSEASQTCGVCSKLLTEKSSFGSQKIIGHNELAVIAVLPCGHVHHAECLENMTSEVNKFDPACPICTFGEKQIMKMSEKVMRAEMDLKAKKRSKNRVIDSDDIESDYIVGGPSLKKSSSGKPFLKRHFSFGSKGSSNKSLLESHSSRKKVFFWTKSSKH